jgi:glycosyltransferase involved in cell wall biosynthesis
MPAQDARRAIGPAANADANDRARIPPDMPLVTVGIATYNGEETIRRALVSLESQTYGAVEVLISDDGSTDSTADICAEFVARNPNWHFLRHPGTPGMLRNYRYLLGQANGDYFTLLDQDDRREPEFLSEAVQVLGRTPDRVGWVSAISVVWGGRGGSSDLQQMHIDFAPASLSSSRPVVRLGALLRRYVDIWMYGVYRTAAMRQAFSVAPESPIFPAVVLTFLVLTGPIARSNMALIEYRAKGQDRRTTVEEDLGRIARRSDGAGRRIPYAVQQAWKQVDLCIQDRSLSVVSRYCTAAAIAWDLAATATGRIAYRMAKRGNSDLLWSLADRVAEVVHPNDHIHFRVDPVTSGYLGRDWRAH